MKIDDCYQIGAIVKTHGLKGEVVLELDVDEPPAYRELESIFLDMSGKLIPFFIEACQLNDSFLRIKFEDVGNPEEAKKLVHCSAHLPLALLPEIDDDQFYFHEIVGFKVIADENLGKVTGIYDQPTNPLFSFEYKGHEVLIPIQDHFIKKVDKSAGEIHVKLPEGYLNIYTEE